MTQQLEYYIDDKIIALLDLLSSNDFRIVITGGIKLGKSALMYHLAELWHKIYPDKKVFVVNFPKKYSYLLPDWIEITSHKKLDEKEDCLILIEEASLVLSSRKWYSGFNILFSQLQAISGHKKQRIIFVTQSLRIIDPNALATSLDALFVKPYKFTSYKMEREELREIISYAWLLFQENGIITREQQLKNVVVIDLLPYPFIYQYSLPSFWRDEISYVWRTFRFNKQKENMKENITERVEAILSEKPDITLKELKRILKDVKYTSLKTIYYRVKARL